MKKELKNQIDAFLSTRHSKLKYGSALTTSLLTFAVGLATPSYAGQVDANATPFGENVVGGSASFDRSQEGRLDITQHTDRTLIDWQRFDIGRNATTEFFQPSSSSIAVNRVTGAGSDPTQILGTLKANGNVMVLDRNGVFFGKDSRVDVGGIVASTGDIDGGKFMADGTVRLSNFGDGKVENQGTITVAEGGLAALVAPTVVNSGVINAKMGRIALAGGNTATTVDFYGDGLVEFEVTDSAKKAIVENSGILAAEGGVIAMTTGGAKTVVDSVINMSGVATAKSASVEGGKIVLGGNGAQVNVSGTLDASGATKGGSVKVTGKNINASETAVIDASSTQSGDGGDIYVYADVDAIFRGRALALAGPDAGNGGFVELSAGNEVGYDGAVSTLAVNGVSGSFLIDPSYVVIHSGSLNNTNFISDKSLANDLTNNASVTIQADNYIDVGTTVPATNVGTGNINLSTGDQIVVVPPKFPAGSPQCSSGHNPNCLPTTTTQNAIAAGNLTLDSMVVNLNKNLTLGTGNLTIDAGTLNLNGTISSRSVVGGATSIVGDSRLIGTGDIGTINVQSNNALIQQAVSFADDSAAPTTINVASGNYQEAINASKANVIFHGANYGIDGNDTRGAETRINSTDAGFHVTAADVTIDGFSIRDTAGANGHGVWVDGVANTAIQNNVINGSVVDGVYANGGSNLSITHNSIKNVGDDGVDVDNTTGTVNISDNLISDTGAASENNGVELLNTSGAVIDNNTIRNTGWNNINLAGAQGTVVSNNKLKNSVNASGVGIWQGSNNTSITGNTITDNQFGIWNQGGTLTIEKNTFSNTTNDAIYLTSTSAAQILNNSIDTITGAGVHVDGGSTGTKIFNNSITAAGQFVNNTAGGTVDASGNWWGTTSEAAIAAGMGGSVDFSPYLVSGTDTDAVTNGFQGDYSALDVTSLGGQTQAGGRINEAIGLLADGSLTGGNRTVSVMSGAYNEAVLINKALNLRGAQAGVDARTRLGSESTVNGSIKTTTGLSDITIDGFTVDGTGITGNNGIYANGVSNLSIINNVVKNNTDTASGRVASDYTTGNGIFVRNGSGTTTVSQNVSNANNDGVRILDTDATALGDVTVSNNFANKNTDRGILIKQSDNALVTGNTTRLDQTGIWLEASAGAKVDGNTILDSTADGIHLRQTSTQNAVITNNSITNSGSRGLFIENGTIATLSGNTFSGGPVYIENRVAGTNLDASNNIFDTLSAWGGPGFNPSTAITDPNTLTATQRDTLFELEAKTNHVIDNASYGKVTYVAGSLFVNSGNSIQGAVNAANAGDKVWINSGTFNESVNVNKLVDLRGYQYGVYAPGRSGSETKVNAGAYGFHITADDAVLNGFTIAGATDRGVWVDNAKGVDVANNRIQNSATSGVYAEKSNGLDVFGNEITATGGTSNGVTVENGRGANIRDNTVSGMGGDGIAVNKNDNAKIQDNSVSNVGGNGIALSNSDNGTVKNNSIASAAKASILLKSDTNTTASGNTITGAGEKGVWVKGGDSVKIKDNSVDGGQYGIYVDNNASNVTIGGNSAADDQNTVTGSTASGIYVGESSLATVRNNLVHGTGKGVASKNAGDLTISDNVIYGTSGDAIEADSSANVVIKDNKIGVNAANATQGTNNVGGEGIDVDSSSSAKISGNFIRETAGNGISATSSESAEIKGNDLAAIGGNGIDALQSDNASIVENILSAIKNDGIRGVKSKALNIARNLIKGTTTAAGAGGNGIFVQNGKDAVINKNIIAGGNGSGNTSGKAGAALDAIHVEGNNNVAVTNNTIQGGEAASGLLARGNGGAGAGQDGIDVSGSREAVITGNQILAGGGNGLFKRGGVGAGGYGILAQNNTGTSSSDGITVDNNQIAGNLLVRGATLDGIRVINSGRGTSGSVDTSISHNTLVNVGGDGIHVENTKGADIIDNSVTGAAGNGIYVKASDSADIARNTLTLIGNNGIGVEGGNDVAISRNTIGNGLLQGAGNDGINVNGGRNATISKNTIQGGLALASGAGHDGIHVDGNREAVITGNTIQGGGLLASGAQNYGIYVKNSGAQIGGGFDLILGQFRDGVLVQDNVITGSNLSNGVNGTAIYVENSSGGIFANQATVSGNTIDHAGNNGIEMKDTYLSTIADNKVTSVDGNGIVLTNADLAQVLSNKISDADAGIVLEDSGILGALVAGNKISDVDTGISADSVKGLFVLDNNIDGSTSGGKGDTGIVVTDSANAQIGAYGEGNKVSHFITGVSVDGSNGAVVRENDVSHVGKTGISASGSANASIDGNDIHDANALAIRLDGSNGAFIGQNDIENVDNGIRAADSSDVLIKGNDLTDIANDGIALSNTDNVEVRGNMIARAINGIILKSSDIFGALIAKNDISDVETGISADKVAGLDIRNNTIDGRTGAGKGETGILVTRSADARIGGDGKGNTVSDFVTGISVDGSNGAVIKGNDVSEVKKTGIAVSGSKDAVIDGNTVHDANALAIRLDGSNGAKIGDNDIDRVDEGVRASDSRNVTVKDNDINDVDGNAIALSNTDDVTVRDNTISNAERGIVLKDSGINGALIAKNNISNVNVGVSASDVKDLEIRNNTIDGRTGFGKGDTGVRVTDSADAQIDGNTVSDFLTGIKVKDSNGAAINGNDVSEVSETGITVSGSNNAVISGNTAHDAYALAILLKDSNGVEIKGNDIDRVIAGILATDSNHAVIKGNEISNVLGGIILSNTDDVTVRANTIDNAFGGIILEDSGIKGAIIAKNEITDVNVGISADDVKDLEIHNNTVDGRTGHGKGYIGIVVTGSKDAQIDGNTVSDFVNGIEAKNSDGVTVKGNDVSQVRKTGIAVKGSDGASIDGNTIHNAKATAISLKNSNGATISGNDIDKTGDGILAADSSDVIVRNNELNDVDGTAIDLSNTDQVKVRANTIDGATNGIVLENSDISDALIANNDISNVESGIAADTVESLIIRNNTLDGRTGGGKGVTGINVLNSADARIAGNAASDFDTGINVDSSDNVVVRDNDVSEAKETGIAVSNSKKAVIGGNTVHDGKGLAISVANSDKAEIDGNDIDGTRGGILVTDSNNVTVSDNELDGVNGNGIEVSGGKSANIIWNKLTNILDAVGIKVSRNNNVVVSDNTVQSTSGSTRIGIEVKNSDNALVGEDVALGHGGNAVSTGTEAGILVKRSDNAQIIHNTVSDGTDADDQSDYGIALIDSNDGTITDNEVSGRETGIYVDPSDNIEVSGNTLNGNGVGIELEDTTNSLILGNTVNGATSAGIKISGTSSGITVDKNIVNGSAIGILTSGENIGSVVLTNNELTDNATGIRLESGLIDLSSLTEGNVINGGSVGLQLDPAGAPESLLLVGDTLGATEFNGQSDFYIRLEDGAYFLSGVPFQIDALNVSFDGFIPANSPFGAGILTLDQLEQLESKIYDLDDALGRGQIFVGFVPGIAQEDLFPNGLGIFGTGGAGFSLTIRGLPHLPGASTGLGALLNNITPFSGGSPEDMANINPAAGGETDGETLNNVEPAGGSGTSVSCWSDMTNAVGGASVSYSFGNSLEDAMNDQASCGG